MLDRNDLETAYMASLLVILPYSYITLSDYTNPLEPTLAKPADED